MRKKKKVQQMNEEMKPNTNNENTTLTWNEDKSVNSDSPNRRKSLVI